MGRGATKINSVLLRLKNIILSDFGLNFYIYAIDGASNGLGMFLQNIQFPLF